MLIINEKFLIIFDEFDSIMFDKDNLKEENLAILKKIPFLISFTGSELMQVHNEILKLAFNSSLINLNSSHHA